MIRCLVVDDSPTFRSVLRSILSRDAELSVAGEAADGREAVELAASLRPDVITLDVHMPRQNGLEALQEIMRRSPAPIVVITAAAGEEAERITFRALELGAVEVVAKPRADDAAGFARQSEEIRRAVRVVAGVRPVTRRSQPAAPPAPPPSVPLPRAAPRCLGIVASTGGPPALQRLLSALPATYPVPIVVVQHIADGFSDGLVDWLSSQCALKVRLAKDGDAVEPGVVLVAGTGSHVLLSGGRVRLDGAPPIRGFRPSGTALLASIAREYGGAGAGLILTGMGDDGVTGLRMLRSVGGLTLAQGKESSAIWGMPRVAVESGAAEASYELDELPEVLLRIASSQAPVRRRPRLLLVDDSETMLSLERHLLARDYELFTARDGKEATEAAVRHRPDAILMDFSMPVMNGGDALRWLRAHPELGRTPVTMVTGENSPDVLRSCREAGAQGILSKPLDPRALMEAVKQMLQASRPAGGPDAA